MEPRYRPASLVISAVLAACGGSQRQEPVTQDPKAPTVATDREILDTPLIPRRLLFGNPDRVALMVSPDGGHVAFLAPEEGVMNVWVAPADRPTAARPVTHDPRRGILQYFWTHTPGRLVYLQDRAGDENFQLFAVDVTSGRSQALTPPGARAEVLGTSARRPRHMAVGVNDRDPRFHDAYLIDVESGERSLLLRNDRFAALYVDHDLEVRLGAISAPDGGSHYLVPGRRRGQWVPFGRVDAADAFSTAPLQFTADGTGMIWLDSRGRNASAVVELPLAGGPGRVLAEDASVDASEILFHPASHVVQAVAFERERKTWRVLDEGVHADLAALEGDVTVTARSVDDTRWTVAVDDDDGPVRYYLYDRRARGAELLFTSRPALESARLASMRPVVIKSRDGLELVSYLTLPPGADGTRPLPMVLLVHGGPWARDRWGYDPEHQWLANRGYAVLAVNYRGSTGFGKQFLNAGDREWGGKMHDDLIDAVNWAITSGVAVPEKIAIMGGSYGGYATLVGLTFTPDTFACGVDIVGVSNLETFLGSIPPYWEPYLDMLAARVGDPRTEAGQQLLAERSPLHYVEHIERPLLIGQGANDPRVKRAESDQIVASMREQGIPVTYAVFPDEGHGFVRPENRLAFYAVAEAFLGECLGGRVEPVGGDLVDSSLQLQP